MAKIQNLKEKIDWDELAVALTYGDPLGFGGEHYLDAETGEVLFCCRDTVEFEELQKKIDNDKTGRYVHIELMPSNVAYGYIEEFIETIEDENLKEKLYIAISGKGAFRRFKDVLQNYPETREKWFEFHDKAVRQYAEEWLDDAISMIENEDKQNQK